MYRSRIFPSYSSPSARPRPGRRYSSPAASTKRNCMADGSVLEKIFHTSSFLWRDLSMLARNSWGKDSRRDQVHSAPTVRWSHQYRRRATMELPSRRCNCVQFRYVACPRSSSPHLWPSVRGFLLSATSYVDVTRANHPSYEATFRSLSEDKSHPSASSAVVKVLDIPGAFEFFGTSHTKAMICGDYFGIFCGDIQNSNGIMVDILHLFNWKSKDGLQVSELYPNET